MEKGMGAFEIYYGDENGWTCDQVSRGYKWSLARKNLFVQKQVIEALKHF